MAAVLIHVTKSPQIFKNLWNCEWHEKVPIPKTHKYYDRHKKFSCLGNLGPGNCTFMHETIYHMLL